MSHKPRYRKYHPRLYHTRMPIFWWVHRWAHIRFITRELTSVFVAFYALVLLLQLRALTQGPAAYEAFIAWLQTPLALALHTVAFLMVLFHTITWFNLAPKAMVIEVGAKPVPGAVIAGMNYLAWVVVSAVLGWLMLTA